MSDSIWCAYCKDYGHNITDCNNDNMYCYYCGKTGHHFSKHGNDDFLKTICESINNHYKWIQNELVNRDAELENIMKKERLLDNIISIYSDSDDEDLKQMCNFAIRHKEKNESYINMLRSSVDKLQGLKTNYRNQMKRLRDIIVPLLNEGANGDEDDIPVARCHICEDNIVTRSAICCGYCMCTICFENIVQNTGSCPNCRKAPLQCMKIIIS